MFPWVPLATYPVIGALEEAAAFVERHAVIPAADVSGQALTAFKAGAVTLVWRREVGTRGRTGRRARAVLAVWGALQGCRGKRGLQSHQAMPTVSAVSRNPRLGLAWRGYGGGP